MKSWFRAAPVDEARRNAPAGTFLSQLPVTARAPRFPASDTVAQNNGGLPNFTRPDFGGDVLWKRIVTSDPREGYYLALPAKLLPRQVEQIKRAGLGGDSWQVHQLEALVEDSWPMYRKCAHEVKQAVAGCKWIIRPYVEAEGKDPKRSAVKKADLVRRSMASMRTDRFATDENSMRATVYNLAGAMLSGISVMEVLWDKRDGEKLPRATTWVHPRHYTIGSDGRLRIVSVKDVGATIVWKSPARRGGLAGVSEEDLAKKFMVAKFTSRSGTALSGGLFRPLAVAWSYWIYGREWISIMAQKHGTPFIHSTYKTGVVSEAEQSMMEARLRDAGANNYLLTPDGVTLNVHPAQALGQDNPIAFLMKQADQAPQYLLLGQTATTEGTPGALGNTESRGDVKKENVQALAEWIGATLTDQWAASVLEMNYGDAGECPTIVPDFAEVASPEKQASRWAILTGPNMPPVLKAEFYAENSLTEPKPGDEVVKNGQVTIAEEAKTDEEKFDADLEKEVKRAEVQMALQSEAQGGEPVGATDRRPLLPAIKAGDKLRATLFRATPSELDDLESRIEAAERAGHKNGECEAVKAAVVALAGGRR